MEKRKFFVEFESFSQSGKIVIDNNIQFAFTIFKKYITLQARYVKLSTENENGSKSVICEFKY